MKEEDILKAIEAALLAGAEIRKVYEDPDADFQVERKADNSPLTIADRRANEVITRVLQQMPYPILSEEGKQLPYAERSAWKELWVVDPLDGTKEFIKRNGEFTVNIAFVREGVPVMGVIYVPVKRDLYVAAEGIGAFKLADITQTGSCSWQELTERAVRLPVQEERDTALHAGDGSLHRTDEAGAWAGGVALQRQFLEDLPDCRGKGGRLSPLCPHDGVGHGGRTCHRACGRR